MKHDALEKFVIDHREEFDDLEPREDLFQEVPEKTSLVISIWRNSLIRNIAAAIIIFAVGFAANDWYTNFQQFTSNDESFANGVADSSLLAFQEMEIYYTSEINQVRQDIILLSNQDEDINNELQIQMDEFNKIFDELKKDLKDQTNDSEVIEAMIMNYRVKLKMLEEMKNQLDPSTNYEEDRYEIMDI